MRQNSKMSTNIRKLKPLYIRHGVINSLHFCQNVNINAASISAAACGTGLPNVRIPPFQVFFIITHVNLLRKKRGSVRNTRQTAKYMSESMPSGCLCVPVPWQNYTK